MRLLNTRDIRSAVLTGLTTGIVAWRILDYLGHVLPMGVDSRVLVFLVPALWVAGVQLGYILSEYYRPFEQFGRFACIGFANAAVDFGILYLLISWTGHAQGTAFSLFKAASFAVATVHSYLWNKYWAFDSVRTTDDGREVMSFVGVALASLVVNVTVASLVVALHPGTVPVQSWAGVSAVVGSAVALVFSFIGLRMFVFRK